MQSNGQINTLQSQYDSVLNSFKKLDDTLNLISTDSQLLYKIREEKMKPATLKKENIINNSQLELNHYWSIADSFFNSVSNSGNQISFVTNVQLNNFPFQVGMEYVENNFNNLKTTLFVPKINLDIYEYKNQMRSKAILKMKQKYLETESIGNKNIMADTLVNYLYSKIQKDTQQYFRNKVQSYLDSVKYSNLSSIDSQKYKYYLVYDSINNNLTQQLLTYQKTKHEYNEYIDKLSNEEFLLKNYNEEVIKEKLKPSSKLIPIKNKFKRFYNLKSNTLDGLSKLQVGRQILEYGSNLNSNLPISGLNLQGNIKQWNYIFKVGAISTLNNSTSLNFSKNLWAKKQGTIINTEIGYQQKSGIFYSSGYQYIKKNKFNSYDHSFQKQHVGYMSLGYDNFKYIYLKFQVNQQLADNTYQEQSELKNILAKQEFISYAVDVKTKISKSITLKSSYNNVGAKFLTLGNPYLTQNSSTLKLALWTRVFKRLSSDVGYQTNKRGIVTNKSIFLTANLTLGSNFILQYNYLPNTQIVNTASNENAGEHNFQRISLQFNKQYKSKYKFFEQISFSNQKDQTIISDTVLVSGLNYFVNYLQFQWYSWKIVAYNNIGYSLTKDSENVHSIMIEKIFRSYTLSFGNIFIKQNSKSINALQLNFNIELFKNVEMEFNITKNIGHDNKMNSGNLGLHYKYN